MSNDILEEAIASHAETLDEQASSLPSISRIADRIDKLELLVDSVAQRAELMRKIDAYVDDLRGEVASIKRIRKFAIFVAVGYILFIVGLLVCLIFYHKLWFFFQGETLRTSIFVVSIASIVAIILTILKGAFKSISERNSDDMMPPSLKVLVESYKDAKDLLPK